MRNWLRAKKNVMTAAVIEAKKAVIEAKKADTGPAKSLRTM
jgi:hypothetical protein